MDAKNNREASNNADQGIMKLEDDPEKDELVCPAGKRLTYRYTFHTKANTGYRAQRRRYEAEDCKRTVYENHGAPPGECGFSAESLERAIQPEPDQRRRKEAPFPTRGGGEKCLWKAQRRLGIPKILAQRD